MTERRKRGTGRLYLPPTSRFWNCAYYNARGARVNESTHETDVRKAERFLKDRLAEVRLDVHCDSRTLTYQRMRDAFLLDYKKNGRKSLRFRKDGSPWFSPVTRLDTYFLGFKAHQITRSQISRFCCELQDAGYANATINRSLAALKKMFRDAEVRNLPKIKMLKEAAPRKGFFEREDYDKLAGTLPPYLRLPFAIGYFCGLRLGEILGLEWEQVDFLRNQIRLGPGKNGLPRCCPVIPELRAALVAQFASRVPDFPYVCWRLDRKGHPQRIRDIRVAWYGSCVKAGLGKWIGKRRYEGKLFHDTRRSAVRNLVRSGVGERVAMTISGHETRSIFERYNITSERDLEDAGKKLAEFHGQKFDYTTATQSEHNQ